MTDWDAIREEYITTDISMRDLAQKHGVTVNTLLSRARRSHWAKAKSNKCKDTAAEAARKEKKKTHTERTQNAHKTHTSTVECDAAGRLFYAAGLAAERAIEMLGMCSTPQELRCVTGSLRDIREIQMIKSALDREEQRARIDKLKAETQSTDDSATEIDVRFDTGGAEK